MPYKERSGNLFASEADALVNTVNCVGPMGKGIALEFRRRFPEMYAVYRRVCEKGQLRPGQILPYRKSTPWILNLAVKDDWKQPSKIEWVEQCLEKFCEWYPTVELRSVAFPWMGAMNGRIPLGEIKETTRRYLSDLKDIDVEVYTFDPNARDPLFDALIRIVSQLDPAEFARQSRMRKNYVDAIYGILSAPNTSNLAGISSSGRLGKTSLDKLYAFLVASERKLAPDHNIPRSPEQLSLL